MIQELNNYKKIILDDGLTHNLTKTLLLEENIEITEKICSERNFILFTNSVSQIVENLRKRSIETPDYLNNWYRIYSKTDLIKKINQEIDNSQRICEIAKNRKSKILIIDLSKNIDINIKRVLNFMSTMKQELNYLTKNRFYDLAHSLNNGHWKSQPLELRWDYHKKAIDILKKIDIESPKDILEIGTVGIQLIENSETLDQDQYWNYEGKKPTYSHDARNIPWPIDKKYKAIVALRVFQYLVPKQKEAFEEAKKLTEHLIIVVPRGEAYRPAGLEKSKGIVYDEFLLWNNSTPPTHFEETAMGDFYYWNFSN